MLSLTKKTEYGLMALDYLSRQENSFCSAREIADACRIPLPLLMNILKLLSQQELISSSRGAKGGYQLSLSAEEITLANVIWAIEGPIKLVRCAGDSAEKKEYKNACDLTDRCSLRPQLLKIHRRMEALLSKITLADISGDGQLPAKILADEEMTDEAYLPGQ